MDNAPVDSAYEAFFGLIMRYKFLVKQELESQGLPLTPVSFRVLRIIAMKERCKATDIVHLLRCDKGQMTRILADMQKDALIERVANPDDKRSQLIRLTDAGNTLLAQLKAVESRIVERMLSRLNSEDHATFLRLCQQISNNLASDQEDL